MLYGRPGEKIGAAQEVVVVACRLPMEVAWAKRMGASTRTVRRSMSSGTRRFVESSETVCARRGQAKGAGEVSKGLHGGGASARVGDSRMEQALSSSSDECTTR